MKQSRIGSLIESLINVVIGFGINFTANMLIFPHFGFHITVADNFLLGGIYTAISIARSYVIRRWFNEKLHRMAVAIGKEVSRADT